MAKSKSINVYLIDGTPTGKIKCTLQNWTGVAYKIPRNLLDTYKDNSILAKHLKQTGIYFLLGESDIGEQFVYVGQASIRKNGEGLSIRLQEHKSNLEKDYWNEAIVFTTQNDALGPTEISYLENKFCSMANLAGRYVVKNGNEPNPGNITEEKESEMEEFVEYARIIMGVLGHKTFEPIITNTPKTNDNEAAKPTVNIKFTFTGSYKAYAELTSEGFVLLKDSEIRKETLKSAGSSTIKKRKKHEQDIVNGVTTCDILFHSPSAASAFVAGRSSSGNVEWKTADGKSPKDF